MIDQAHLVHQRGPSFCWSFGIFKPGVHNKFREIVGVCLQKDFHHIQLCFVCYFYNYDCELASIHWAVWSLPQSLRDFIVWCLMARSQKRSVFGEKEISYTYVHGIWGVYVWWCSHKREMSLVKRNLIWRVLYPSLPVLIYLFCRPTVDIIFEQGKNRQVVNTLGLHCLNMCLLWNNQLFMIVLSQKIKLLCKPALMLHHVPKLWQWIPLSPAWCVSSPKISNLVISKNLLATPSTTSTGWFWHAHPVSPIKKNLQKLSYMENIMDQEFELFFHYSPGYWMCQLKKHPIPGLHNLWQPGCEKMERELENEEEMERKWGNGE